MSKPPIRLGDPTSHGGEVVSASSTTTFYGKAVACVGDRVSCPRPGHDNCVIVEGSTTLRINGKAIALDGDKTSCGAVLLATFGNVMHDMVGGGSLAGMAAQTSAIVTSHSQQTQAPHDEQFHLVDAHGNPHSQTHYTAKLPSGELIHGVTDDHGKTERIRTQGAQRIDIYFGHLEQ